MTYSAFAGDTYLFKVSNVDNDGDAMQKARKIDPAVTHVVAETVEDQDEHAVGW